MSNPLLSNVFGGYEYHIYARKNGIMNGDIEEGIALRRKEINANDVHGREKHVWVSEIGLKDGKEPTCDKQINISTYQYGMDTADIMIQIIRSISLLSRLFPMGSYTLAVPTIDGIRIAAAKYTNKNGDDLSLAIINQGDTNRDIDLILTGSSILNPHPFNMYSYSENSYYQKNPLKTNQTDKLHIFIPQHSIVFLTTFDR